MYLKDNEIRSVSRYNESLTDEDLKILLFDLLDYLKLQAHGQADDYGNLISFIITEWGKNEISD